MGEATWNELVRVMPPHAGAGDSSVDWEDIESAWGTRLPDDYRRFITAYGEGGIENFLEILSPRTADGDDFESEMAEETANARGEWEPVPAAGPDAAPLIAWGVDTDGDILCWLTTGNEPNQWPVAVWGRHADTPWTIYDCTMTKFLVKIFGAEFAECPLSGTDLWDKRHVTFLHRREEQRLRTQGINPWTGGANLHVQTDVDD
ncbi:SMI1/KNR4 family protein [Streptomyces rimosus]|uniref:SMI1/KNR4 family protein n=1 Tax=Streptomyces rimosus TaxID=1927 RepID=UPI0004C548C5|nr:SMI1/KNR4 family protein [Streptomyces rimosus]